MNIRIHLKLKFANSVMLIVNVFFKSLLLIKTEAY